MSAFEYRISYRRTHWSENTSTKSRTFQRRHDARRFLAKLRGDDRPDLSEAIVTVHRREVGAWEQIVPRDPT